MSSIVSPSSPSEDTIPGDGAAAPTEPNEVSIKDAVRINPRPTEAAETAKEEAAEGCSNCGSLEPWGMSSWCPSCGYYPTLNTTVEVEPPPIAVELETEEEKSPATELLQAVPTWGWILLGGVGAVLVMSIVARLTIADTMIPRGKLAILQCVLGLCVALVGHWMAYFHAMTASEKFGPFDVLMKPVAIYDVTIRGLPDLAWRLWCVAWGLSMAICALVVIGGVSYSAIFDDWGADKRAAPNVVHAITEQARREREGGADSLEEAITDFVGDEGLTEEERNELAAADLERIDCLIFGYTTQGDEPTDDFSLIVLATMIDERVRFVGTLQAHEISEGARATLNERMHTLRRQRPFVQMPQTAAWMKDAHWLRPVMMCQLGFKGWTNLRRLREPMFVRLLGDVAERP